MFSYVNLQFALVDKLLETYRFCNQFHHVECRSVLSSIKTNRAQTCFCVDWVKLSARIFFTNKMNISCLFSRYISENFTVHKKVHNTYIRIVHGHICIVVKALSSEKAANICLLDIHILMSSI